MDRFSRRALNLHAHSLCAWRDLGCGVVVDLVAAFYTSCWCCAPRSASLSRRELFPAIAFSEAITQHFEQAAGKKPAYIIGSMSRTAAMSRTTLASARGRACWSMACRTTRPGTAATLAEVCAERGAAVGVDAKPGRRVLPAKCGRCLPERGRRTVATCPTTRGEGVVHVGWAIAAPPQRLILGA